jgi:hypothetical protein
MFFIGSDTLFETVSPLIYINNSTVPGRTTQVPVAESELCASTPANNLRIQRTHR